MINVKETIEANNLRTARGRQTLKGKEVKANEVTDDEKRNDAMIRTEVYLSVARELRREVSRNSKGITYDELDAVDFIIEYIDGLARKAVDTAIDAN